MADIQNRFDRLLASCRAFYDASPELREFAAWPDDLKFDMLAPRTVPAVALLESWQGEHPIHHALHDVAREASWQRSYSEAQVGQQFLKSYGFIELFGPQGHYTSVTGRAFIGYWGAGLKYDWHQHEAEEIYAIVSGGALFRSEGVPDAYLSSGMTRRHDSFQSHAFSMTDGPLLAFAMWRGAGMDEPTSEANSFSHRSAYEQCRPRG